MLKTTGSRLAYCDPKDLLMGTGVDRFSKESNEPALWTGENLLGDSLQKVRDLFFADPMYRQEVEEIMMEKSGGVGVDVPEKETIPPPIEDPGKRGDQILAGPIYQRKIEEIGGESADVSAHMWMNNGGSSGQGVDVPEKETLPPPIKNPRKRPGSSDPKRSQTKRGR
ncbi:MAG: NADAR family protein [Gammaproteobacteria bacterium]|nr:NADAR family protein [Gammaproteobacteria bacterium]